ncbi:MAG TPA: two-component regulator propeller domain-containing protein [Blastocatellia bacterium]|nr:two-component regulator propeller domain-containing protein [Blastocatellia bacterium]
MPCVVPSQKQSAAILSFFFIALVAAVVFSQSSPSTSEPASSLVAETPEPAADNATLNLHRWGAVTLFHGLPSDRVNAIAEDASGALWFGTDNGLVRYDGRRTQLVTGEGANALPSPRIRALKPDAAGGLWIGTDGGAARLFNGQLELIAATQGRAVRGIAEAPGREITVVTERGEILHFATAGSSDEKAIKRSSPYADPDFGKVVTRKFDATSHWQLSTGSAGSEARPTELTAIAFSEKSGEWWIGSHSRGALVNKGGDVREAMLRNPRPYFVESVFAAGHRVWIGAQAGRQGGGLWFEQDGALAQFPLSTGTVTSLHGDETDVWIGTNNQGAFLLRNEQALEHLTFENTSGGLRSNHINAVFRDHEGIIWFGTDRGVCRYDRDSFRAARVSANGNSNYIRTMLVTRQGETLAGTNRGLFTLARAAEPAAWTQLREPGERAVYALAEDDAGAVWAGTSSGLFVRHSAGAAFVPVIGDASASPPETAEQGISNAEAAEPRNRNSVRAVVKFRGQIYALLFERGLERIEAGRRVPVLNDETVRRALCLAVEPGAAGNADAAIWIGTENGEVVRFDGEKTSALPRDKTAAISGAAVRAIAFASGRAWLGAERGLFEWNAQTGQLSPVIAQADVFALLAMREQQIAEVQPQAALGRFVPGRQAAQSTESAQRDGFTENAESLPQPREVIWCGTKNAGLYKLLARDRVMIRFDTEQGLSSQQVFAVAADQQSDRVWIGTNRGIVLHQPGHVPPRIEARRFVADRVYTPEDLNAEVGLEHTQANFLLEVAGLGSRTFPGQFQYEFTLRDKLGRPVRTLLTTDSQFAVERLARGPYAIWVRAISRDLVYSEPLKVRFRIPNAPFPRTQVILGVLLIVALGAAGYAFIQNRRIARANRQLEETNIELQETRLRLANETEAERSRIARDLHDQTLADLRHLLVLIDQLEKGSAASGATLPTPATLRREIESISSEIRHICEDLSPSVLENIGFLPALEWALSDAVAHLPAEEKFTWEFICEGELEDRLELSEIERIQLYRIVQEAINNICRHAQARQVRMTVRTAADDDRRDLIIEITDDGIGFDGSRHSATGHGILNIRSRANLIGAEVAWQNLSRNGDSGGCRFEVRKGACVK